MNVKSLATVEAVFFAIVTASITICAIGPLAVALNWTGAWLFVWVPLFWIIRLLGIFVFPFVALLLAWRALSGGRRRAVMVFVDLFMCVALLGLVFSVQHWSRGRARSQFESQFPGAAPGVVAAIASRARILPNVALKSLDGRDVTVSDQLQSAKLTVIVFWASYDQVWSGTLQLASAVFQDFRTNGLQVIGVNEQEQPVTVRAYTNSHGAQFPTLMDPQGAFLRACRLWGSVERIIIVDTNGTVLDDFKPSRDEETRFRAAVRNRLAVR